MCIFLINQASKLYTVYYMCQTMREIYDVVFKVGDNGRQGNGGSGLVINCIDLCRASKNLRCI
jgi:hypothetical protein